MKRKLVLTLVAALGVVCVDASAETLSERSGKVGNVIAETRVDSGDSLRGMMILEQSDRPCVVQIYSDLIPVESYVGRIDKCNGGGPKKAKGIDSSKGQVVISGGGSYVTGLKVCLSSSDRVKGWTLYGKSNSSPNTISESFVHTNCPNDGWQTRVDCPTDANAIGVRAYFEPGTGNRSDALRGMQLICN
jgi:hypothetical protein